MVLLLISGASGAGKTSVREAIAEGLAPRVEAVELRHLDTVPAVPVIDGSAMSVAEAGHAALQWVGKALSGRAPVFRRRH